MKMLLVMQNVCSVCSPAPTFPDGVNTVGLALFLDPAFPRTGWDNVVGTLTVTASTPAARMLRFILFFLTMVVAIARTDAFGYSKLVAHYRERLMQENAARLERRLLITGLPDNF